MANKKIQGRKGGSSSPVRRQNSLTISSRLQRQKSCWRWVKVNFLAASPDSPFSLDGTPLLNADGSSNFSGVTWEFRAGTQAQTYIQGMPGSENEISAGGITVSSATPWTRIYEYTTFSRSPAHQMAVYFPSGR
jgi:hypothetical protein